MAKLTRALLAIAVAGNCALLAAPSQAETVTASKTSTSQPKTESVTTVPSETESATTHSDNTQLISESATEASVELKTKAQETPKARTRKPIPCRIFPVPSMMQ